MRHKIYFSALVAVISSAMVMSCKSKDKADAEQAPVIDVAAVTIDSVTTHKSYPGYLTANDEVDLVARVDGYLTAKPYEAGAFVRKGTVLFVIESTQYADVVVQAQATLDNAQAEYDYAQKHYQAMLKALESNAVSKMEVLQAKSSVEANKAAIANARAALRTAQSTLSYCTVRAPFDGHVSTGTYSVGTYLNGAGSPVVLGRIYDDAIMTANFSINDDEFIQLIDNKTNKALDIDLTRMPVSFDDALPHDYTADLSYMAPSIDKSTGTMVVQGKIRNEFGELRSGMYCKINVPDKVLKKAVLVRDASIGTDQLGKYVYVVNDSDKVVYTPVEVGELVADTMRIITKGLTPADRYVTKALLKVRDGMTVKPRLTSK